jgi:hypothetical protein
MDICGKMACILRRAWRRQPMHTGIHRGNSGNQEKIADIFQFPRAFYQKLRTANVMRRTPTGWSPPVQ